VYGKQLRDFTMVFDQKVQSSSRVTMMRKYFLMDNKGIISAFYAINIMKHNYPAGIGIVRIMRVRRIKSIVKAA
jgi:hypothetical protein